MGRELPSEKRIAYDIRGVLAQRIPPDWTFRADEKVRGGPCRADLVAEVTSPKGETAVFVIEIKRFVPPRGVADLARGARELASNEAPRAVPIVGAAYLSPRTREMLRDLGVGYIDTTGNVHIEATAPGLFVSAAGADRDPWPKPGGVQSLRGRGAGRAVRAIIDTAPPFGVRELARATSTSAPTLSRVLGLLEREGIVTRRGRGPVVGVEWQDAIRRWAQDYDQSRSNTATALLEPRGLARVTAKLQSATFLYAATGAFAAQRFDPVAGARAAALYVEDAAETSERLGLRETDTGANVVLLEPFDPVVFDRTLERDGLRCVAPSQLAVDLLTGPGREPSQGEQMLIWMKQNEDVWRT